MMQRISKNHVSLETLSQLAGPTMLSIREVARVGGGRGLFVEMPVKKGAQLGPIPPLAAAPGTVDILMSAAIKAPRFKPAPTAAAAAASGEKPKFLSQPPKKNKPKSAKSDQRQRRKLHAAAADDARAELCSLCFLVKSEATSCANCNMKEGRDRKLVENERLVHKTFKVLHELNSQRGAAMITETNRFPTIAQGLLLRCITEEVNMLVQNNQVIIGALMFPETGTGIKSAWKEDWEKSKKIIEEVCARVKIPLEGSILWSGLPEQQELGSAEDLFLHCMACLHVNSIRGPESSALYGSLSFANHSCDPSVNLAFSGAMAYIVPRRDLAVGDEITFDYTGGRNLKQAQMEKFLSWNYGFKCKVDCGCNVQDRSASE